MEALKVVAESWPIAVMVVGLAAISVANRRMKQAMDDSQAVQDLRASQSTAVRRVA